MYHGTLLATSGSTCTGVPIWYHGKKLMIGTEARCALQAPVTSTATMVPWYHGTRVCTYHGTYTCTYNISRNISQKRLEIQALWCNGDTGTRVRTRRLEYDVHMYGILTEYQYAS